MFSKKKTETDLLYFEINRLKKQNKKLMEENKQLHDMLGEIEKYKAQYKAILDDIKKIKERYQEKIKKFERIQSLFVDEYNELKEQI